MRHQRIKNFFVLSNFKLIFPALAALAQSKRVQIDGFICPGHVSVITGSLPYERIARRYKKPCVITGFEENDIVKGIKRLAELIKSSTYKAEIVYKRAVSREGNIKARQILHSLFTVCDSQWRGLGRIRRSGLKLRKEFKQFCAEKEFNIDIPRAKQVKGCICGEVLQGIKSARDCRLMKKVCRPENPVGPCMVSSEGTCAAYYKYGEQHDS